MLSGALVKNPKDNELYAYEKFLPEAGGAILRHLPQSYSGNMEQRGIERPSYVNHMRERVEVETRGLETMGVLLFCVFLLLKHSKESRLLCPVGSSKPS
jgi:hypothetical protein